MGTNFRLFLERRIHSEAKRCYAQRVGDSMYDADDYASIFRIHFHERLLKTDLSKIRDLGAWVNSVIYHKRLDLHRRRLRVMPDVVDREVDKAFDQYPRDLESCVADRELLRLLRTALSVEDWESLIAYGDAGSYKAACPDIDRKQAWARIKPVVLEARYFLKNVVEG